MPLPLKGPGCDEGTNLRLRDFSSADAHPCKCEACRVFYRFFHSELINSIGARMLDSIYHMAFKLLNNRILA